MNPVSLTIALLLIILFALYLYRFTGRRQFLRFDLVQFLYAFVVYPFAFLWTQELLLLFYRSVPEIGAVDQRLISTSVNLVFLYSYAFAIMHSLTKTLSLRVYRDPLFDVFSQTKYVHEFLSHVGMYTAVFVMGIILSAVNGFFPLPVESTRSGMFALLTISSLMGIFLYVILFVTTDKGVGYVQYKRIIRAVIGLTFAAQVLLFVLLRPSFTTQFGIYWMVTTTLSAFVFTRLFLIPTRTFWAILNRIGLSEGRD